MSPQPGGDRAGIVSPEEFKGRAVFHVIGLGVHPGGQEGGTDPAGIRHLGADGEEGGTAPIRFFLEAERRAVFQQFPEAAGVCDLGGQPFRETPQLPQSRFRLEGRQRRYASSA